MQHRETNCHHAARFDEMPSLHDFDFSGFVNGQRFAWQEVAVWILSEKHRAKDGGEKRKNYAHSLVIGHFLKWFDPLCNVRKTDWK